MKRVLAITLPILAVTFSACGPKGLPADQVHLSGTVTNALAGDTIYLEQLGSTAASRVDASVIYDDGTYNMAYTAPEAGFYRLRIGDDQIANLVLEPGDKPVVNGDAKDLKDSYTVTGSPESQRLKAMNDALTLLIQVKDSCKTAREELSANRDMPGLQKVQLREGVVSGQVVLTIRNLIADKPASLVSLIAVQQLEDPSTYFTEFELVEKGMAEMAPNSEYHNWITSMIAPVRSTQAGAAAPEILMENPQGKPVALSSLRGKVVLIDFWASWCRPCRAENPNVVRLYKQYNKKGFEVFSVSLDKEKERWIQAIEQDGLAWTHVSDLAWWNSAAAKTYNVKSIPATFLLDREGKIIAKGLRGPELEAKLAELFGG